MILAMSGQQLDQASRAVNQAIAGLGTTDFLYDTRGLVRLATGRPKLAEQDFRASIETEARPDRLLHLAQALYAQQNIDEARAALKQAARGRDFGAEIASTRTDRLPTVIESTLNRNRASATAC